MNPPSRKPSVATMMPAGRPRRRPARPRPRRRGRAARGSGRARPRGTRAPSRARWRQSSRPAGARRLASRGRSAGAAAARGHGRRAPRAAEAAARSPPGAARWAAGRPGRARSGSARRRGSPAPARPGPAGRRRRHQRRQRHEAEPALAQALQDRRQRLRRLPAAPVDVKDDDRTRRAPCRARSRIMPVGRRARARIAGDDVPGHRRQPQILDDVDQPLAPFAERRAERHAVLAVPGQRRLGLVDLLDDARDRQPRHVRVVVGVIAELDQRIAGQLGHRRRRALRPSAPRRRWSTGIPLALDDVEHVAIEAGEVGARRARVERDRDGRLARLDVADGQEPRTAGPAGAGLAGARSRASRRRRRGRRCRCPRPAGRPAAAPPDRSDHERGRRVKGDQRQRRGPGMSGQIQQHHDRIFLILA